MNVPVPRTPGLAGLILGLLLAAPLAGGTQASPAARDVLFMDIAGAADVATGYFPAAAVAKMRARLARAIDPKPALRNPFGAKFAALSEWGLPGHVAVAEALGLLWTASCGIGACKPFTDFMAALGKRTRVRAVLSSRGYSGCAEAAFERMDGLRPMVRMTLSARQFFNCPRTTRRPVTSYALPLG